MVSPLPSLVMRNLWILFILLGLAGREALANEKGLKKSVVKLYTVIKRPNFYQPWEGGYQKNSGGSGCILKGNRILTNAHVVSDQVYVQVQKVGDSRKFTTRVEHVAHDGELAVLNVEDPTFFEGTIPVSFGTLPKQRDKVAAYGFPIGGDDLSITEGVVSRIEVGAYTHSQRDLLTIQIDAAINPGNSGGPVFQGDKLIGVAFQSYSGTGVAENVGYVVPISLIERFLKDIEDGSYDGIPTLGIYWQRLENKSLRQQYGLKASDNGVLITRVVYESSTWGILQENDVMATIGGYPIANDGTIPFRQEERLNFSHVISQFKMGEKLEIQVIREGKLITLTVTLKKHKPLIPGPQYDLLPTHFIFAGLVFVPLSYSYIIGGWGWEKAVTKFQYLYSEALPSQQRREIVVISQVLAHDINVGYHKLRDAVVEKINGVPIIEMKDVLKAIQKPVGNFHIIEIDHHAASGHRLEYWPDFGARIVLDAATAEQATQDILKRYRIAKDRSPNLEDVK